MMKYILSVLLIISSCYFGFSQVGINTTDPDASAALDIVADDSGILIPRMTTLQKTQIVDPAHSLLVYDTDLEGYYFNQGTTEIPNWTPMLSKKDERNNYVLVKSVDDLPEASGVGGTITLDPNTFYEINGRISLTASIDLNNAYVSGKDASEDVLSFPGGTVFAGDTGGNIRNVTLEGAQAFEINVVGNPASSLLVQNTIISGMTVSVGQVSGLGLFFSNIIQFTGNANGITYSNIGNLLLNNQAWFFTNSGTYETFTGTFGFIQKVSGFSTVSIGATGLDVSANPTVEGSGTIKSVVFSGGGNFVNPYTSTETYPGFNFTKVWDIDCVGIPEEEDGVASASMYYVGAGLFTSSSSSAKINLTTTVSNLFRFGHANNKLTYEGSEPRVFNISGSLSYNSGGSPSLIFYIKKINADNTAADIENTKIFSKGSTGWFGDGGTMSIPLTGTVTLKTGESVEVWVLRQDGSTSITVRSLNLSIN